MPKGLKATSQQIVISFGVDQTNPNDTVSERIDLQLNALDNEVFVISGVKLDLDAPDFEIGGVGTSTKTRIRASLSKQDISTSGLGYTLANPSVFATQEHEVHTFVNGTPPDLYCAAIGTSSDATDTPAHIEYVDIIATPDFFVNLLSSNCNEAQGVTGKLYGYRARADASVYASLVQSELLSV